MTRKTRPLGLPRLDDDVAGTLIVIEGTDGVGRSTHIDLLAPWVEANGLPVVTTGWTRSLLVNKLITSAKEGTLLNKTTYTMLYATDFADRLERVVIPALQAGMVVVADRYVGTALGRAKVRGIDEEWIRNVYQFAPRPDLTLYLDIDVDDLLPRILERTRLDFWESGMDEHMGEDIYDSFTAYQQRLLHAYRSMAEAEEWRTIDARGSLEGTQRAIRRAVAGELGFPADSADGPLTASGRVVQAK